MLRVTDEEVNREAPLYGSAGTKSKTATARSSTGRRRRQRRRWSAGPASPRSAPSRSSRGRSVPLAITRIRGKDFHVVRRLDAESATEHLLAARALHVHVGDRAAHRAHPTCPAPPPRFSSSLTPLRGPRPGDSRLILPPARSGFGFPTLFGHWLLLLQGARGSQSVAIVSSMVPALAIASQGTSLKFWLPLSF